MAGMYTPRGVEEGSSARALREQGVVTTWRRKDALSLEDYRQSYYSGVWML